MTILGDHVQRPSDGDEMNALAPGHLRSLRARSTRSGGDRAEGPDHHTAESQDDTGADVTIEDDGTIYHRCLQR